MKIQDFNSIIFQPLYFILLKLYWSGEMLIMKSRFALLKRWKTRLLYIYSSLYMRYIAYQHDLRVGESDMREYVCRSHLESKSESRVSGLCTHFVRKSDVWRLVTKNFPPYALWVTLAKKIMTKIAHQNNINNVYIYLKWFDYFLLARNNNWMLYAYI